MYLLHQVCHTDLVEKPAEKDVKVNETGQEVAFLFHGNFNIKGLLRIKKRTKTFVLENHFSTSVFYAAFI